MLGLPTPGWLVCTGWRVVRVRVRLLRSTGSSRVGLAGSIREAEVRLAGWLAGILTFLSDWIIGYDTGEYQEGNKLSYVLPGLIQLGGSPGHHDGGFPPPAARTPGEHGWLYLTKHREWNYDPGVRVSPRWSR